jgi:hypothetical protein
MDSHRYEALIRAKSEIWRAIITEIKASTGRIRAFICPDASFAACKSSEIEDLASSTEFVIANCDAFKVVLVWSKDSCTLSSS